MVTKDSGWDDSTRTRSVLYEELAEYYYRACAPQRLRDSNVNSEVEYHVRNLTLLSLYFDSIVITSATIFNVRDQFVSRIIFNFLAHERVREMLDIGVLKILGWGGGAAQDMFNAASEYAGKVLQIQHDAERFIQLRSVFNPRYVVSRSSKMPDTDLACKYIQRLEDTSIVSEPSQLATIVDEVQRQHDRTKSLIAIEMLPSLDGVVLSESSLDIAKLQLFGVTIEHMRDEIPDLWVYSPFLAAGLSAEATHTSQGAPRAFLLSPMIFGAFLNMHIDAKTFDLLMNDSYHTLQVLKNGDWRRFVKAYHEAIQDVSSALSLGMHLSYDQLRDFKSQEWADKVVGRIKAEGADLDVSAFIDSLVGIGSVLLAVPALKPVAKLLTTAIGDRLSNAVSRLSKKHRGQISPFIIKLERAYLT